MRLHWNAVQFLRKLGSAYIAVAFASTNIWLQQATADPITQGAGALSSTSPLMHGASLSASQHSSGMHMHNHAWQAQSGQSTESHRAPLNLNLSSTTQSMHAGHLAGNGTTITVGGTSEVVTKNTTLTPAEYLALQQVVRTGTQTLDLSAAGAAIGGTASIGNHLASHLSSLVIPQNVTVLYNAGRTDTLQLSGNLTNNGSLLLYSTNPLQTTATVSASNIYNQAGGILSTAPLPASLATGVNGLLVHNLNLNLNAVGSIVNAGTITSSGNLGLIAGTSITNSGIASGSLSGALQTHPGTILAANSLTVQTPSLINNGLLASQKADVALAINSLTNGGTISAVAGNVNIANLSSNQLTVHGLGGNINAAGSINVILSSLDPHTSPSLQWLGGNLSAQAINLNSPNGSINASFDNVTGALNTTADVVHVLANSDVLELGTIKVSGDPTIYNSGDILIGGDISVGENLAIIAGGSITTAAGVNAITAQDSSGQGYNITLIAGANFTTSGSPGAISVSVNGASQTGGNIDFSATPGLAINASSSQGNGGNVTMAAFANGDGTGYINAPGCVINTQSPSGNYGNVTLIAGATSGTGISVGGVNTSATPASGGTGQVAMYTAQPTTSDGNPIIFDSTGTVVSGNSLVPDSTIQSSSINITDAIRTPDAINITAGAGISASGSGFSGSSVALNGGSGAVSVSVDAINGTVAASGNGVSLNTGGTLTTGAITSTGGVELSASSGDVQLTDNISSGGNLAVLASGSISCTPGLASIRTQDASGQGHDIQMIAGANIVQGSGTVGINGVSLSGGSIDLSASPNVTIDSSSSTGNGGNVTMAAFANGDGSGYINAPGCVINTQSPSGNSINYGNVALIAGATSGTGISIGGINTMTPASGGTGQVDIYTAQPTISDGNPIMFDSTGTVVSGNSLVPDSLIQNSSVNITDAIRMPDAINITAGAGISASGSGFSGSSVLLRGGSGAVSVNVDAIMGTVSASGNGVSLNTGGTLTTGAITSTGGVELSASHGDVQLTDNISSGGNLAVLASGNITCTPGLTSIRTQDASGQGHDIQMIAGANIVQGNGTVGVDGVSLSGGSIDLSASPNVTIDSSSSTGNGGNVTMAAYANTMAVVNTGVANINLPAGSTINTSGAAAGNNGNVTLIAGECDGGLGISVGAINANGGSGYAPSTGQISITTAQPTSSDGNPVMFDGTGSVVSSNSLIADSVMQDSSVYIAGPIGATTQIDVSAGAGISAGGSGFSGSSVSLNGGSGAVRVNVVAINGTVSASGNGVSLNTGGTLTTGAISSTAGVELCSSAGSVQLTDNISSGGNLAVIAAGDITSTSGLTSIRTADSSGQGHDIQMIAGANATTYRRVTVDAANPFGGNIDFSASPYLRIDAGISPATNGLISFNGLSRFTVTSPATTSSGSVSLTGDDGSGINSYSVDMTAMPSISAGTIFTLTNPSSGNSITLMNKSGHTITTSTDLATYLSTAYPVAYTLKTNNGNGSNVTMAAFANGSGTGYINLPVGSQINTSGVGSGNNGNVTLIAGATEFTGISVGAINAGGGSGTAVGTGQVALSTAQPLTSDGAALSFNVLGSPLSANYLIPSSTVAGAVINIPAGIAASNAVTISAGGGINVMGSGITGSTISLNGGSAAVGVNVDELSGTVSASANGVSITSVSSITAGSISSIGGVALSSTSGNVQLGGNIYSGGNLAIIAGGNITSTPNLTYIMAQDSTGQGYNIQLIAGADNISSSQTVSVSGTPSMRGGYIDFSASPNVRINANIGVPSNGVVSLNGLARFIVTTPASNSSGTVTMLGNDSFVGQTSFSMTFSSAIGLGAPFTLTNDASGTSITFSNNSGGTITSANELATYLSSMYPVSDTIRMNNGNGGNVTMAAFANGSGTGYINLPAGSAINTSGGAVYTYGSARGTNNGNVMLIAGAASGTAISIGSINASGGSGTRLGTGNITAAAAQPISSDGNPIVFGPDGWVVSGNSLLPGPSNSSSGGLVLTATVSASGLASLTSGASSGIAVGYHASLTGGAISLTTPLLNNNGTIQATQGILAVQSNASNNLLTLDLGGGSTLNATGTTQDVTFNAANAGSIVAANGIGTISATNKVTFNGGTNAVDVSVGSINGNISGSGTPFSVSVASGDVALGAISTAGNLSFTSPGNLSVNGAVAAGGTIGLTSAGGSTNSVTVCAGCTVAGTAVTLTTPTLTNDGTVQATTGGLAIQSNGTTHALSLILGNGSILEATGTAQDVTFNGTTAGTVVATGGYGTISATNNVNLNGGMHSVILNVNSITGTVSANGGSLSITAGSSITAAAITAFGGVMLNSTSGNLILSDNTRAGGGLVLMSGPSNSVSIADGITVAGSAVGITTPTLSNSGTLKATSGDLNVESDAVGGALTLNLANNSIIEANAPNSSIKFNGTTAGAISTSSSATGLLSATNQVEFNGGTHPVNVSVYNIIGNITGSGNPFNVTKVVQPPQPPQPQSTPASSVSSAPTDNAVTAAAPAPTTSESSLSPLVASFNAVTGTTVVSTDKTQVRSEAMSAEPVPLLQGGVSEDKDFGLSGGSAYFFGGSFSPEALSDLSSQGVKLGQGSNANVLYLDQGIVLFCPKSDIIVNAKEGAVHIPAGSVGMVYETGNDSVIYDFVDDFSKPIRVQAASETFDLRPGQQLVLTKDGRAGFDAVNPGKGVGYRDVEKHELSNGITVYCSDFSIVSAIANHLPCRALRTIDSAQAKHTVDRMMKTAAAVYMVTLKKGPYTTSSSEK